jgi:hypothetical protein
MQPDRNPPPSGVGRFKCPQCFHCNIEYANAPKHEIESILNALLSRANLDDRLPMASEGMCLKLMRQEAINGKGRKTFLIRIFKRYAMLRRQREIREIEAGG